MMRLAATQTLSTPLMTRGFLRLLSTTTIACRPFFSIAFLIPGAFFSSWARACSTDEVTTTKAFSLASVMTAAALDVWGEPDLNCLSTMTTTSLAEVEMSLPSTSASDISFFRLCSTSAASGSQAITNLVEASSNFLLERQLRFEGWHRNVPSRAGQPRP
jgi:hypothetical protein